MLPICASAYTTGRSSSHKQGFTVNIQYLRKFGHDCIYACLVTTGGVYCENIQELMRIRRRFSLYVVLGEYILET